MLEYTRLSLGWWHLDLWVKVNLTCPFLNEVTLVYRTRSSTPNGISFFVSILLLKNALIDLHLTALSSLINERRLKLFNRSLRLIFIHFSVYLFKRRSIFKLCLATTSLKRSLCSFLDKALGLLRLNVETLKLFPYLVRLSSLSSYFLYQDY